MMRDQALAASGLLVRTIGGAEREAVSARGLWEELATGNATDYDAGHGRGLYRRSLYTFWKRSAPPPSADQVRRRRARSCTVQRQRTNTPLQALVLMNDPQFVEAARALAERMMREGGRDADARITAAFRLLTGRPRGDELRHAGGVRAAAVASSRGNADAAKARRHRLGEKPPARDADPVERAA